MFRGYNGFVLLISNSAILNASQYVSRAPNGSFRGIAVRKA